MKAIFFMLLLASLAGCSTATLYDQIAAQTAPDCNKIVNAEDRNRCKKETDVSYEEYERQRQKAKNKP
jgi:uncharacterized OsmC-like protein